MRVGIYARVSTHDQQTLPMQLKQIREYIKNRKWKMVAEGEEIGSGAKRARVALGSFHHLIFAELLMSVKIYFLAHRANQDPPLKIYLAKPNRSTYIHRHLIKFP